jgi:hypothetical protein
VRNLKIIQNIVIISLNRGGVGWGGGGVNKESSPVLGLSFSMRINEERAVL